MPPMAAKKKSRHSYVSRHRGGAPRKRNKRRPTKPGGDRVVRMVMLVSVEEAKLIDKACWARNLPYSTWARTNLCRIADRIVRG